MTRMTSRQAWRRCRSPGWRGTPVRPSPACCSPTPAWGRGHQQPHSLGSFRLGWSLVTTLSNIFGEMKTYKKMIHFHKKFIQKPVEAFRAPGPAATTVASSGDFWAASGMIRPPFVFVSATARCRKCVAIIFRFYLRLLNLYASNIYMKHNDTFIEIYLN